jgi:hypothetical protein
MKYKMLFLIILPIFMFGQDNTESKCNCSCSTVLYYKQIKIPLFDGKGKVVCYIIDDTIKEDYYGIIIKKIDKKRNLAYVYASAILYDTIPKAGWIETKYLGVYPSNFSTINLYFKPSRESKIKSKIFMPEFFPFHILDCRGDWLYVSYLDVDKKIKEGWLDPEDQSSNPYSTSN